MKFKSILKSLLFFQIFISLFFAGISSAQNWEALLTVDPLPSPYISDWQIDPTIASLEIQNNSPEQDVIIVYLEVTDGDGNLMMQASSRRLLILPNQPVFLNSTGYMDWNVTYLHESLKNQTARSGMFPEGDYEACISVKNLWGTELVSQACAYFTIRHPEPPELIYPIDNESVFMPYPVFQWIPPQLQSSSQMVFIFRLVEVMPGQDAQRALEANYPHYENFNVFDSNLEYPLDALPLEANKTYAWQIQAVDLEGRPATKNEGRSIVGTFTLSAWSQNTFTGLDLIFPENEAVLETIIPVFEWQCSSLETETTRQYNIQISPVHPGQTPEQAMELNTAQFLNSVPISGTQLVYPGSADPLIQGEQYAWQVKIADASGLTDVDNEAKSEIRTFTISDKPVGIKVQLPDRIPLPSEDIAYIEFPGGGLTSGVSLEQQGSTVRLFTEPGRTADLKVPGLAYGSSNIPTIPVSFDVFIDTVTYTITGGTIDVNKGETLFQAAPEGIPLNVTRLKYQKESGKYGLFADVMPVLPKAVNSASVTFKDIPVTGSGLSGTSSAGNYSETYQNNSALANTLIGGVLDFTVTGAKAVFGSNSNSIDLSGNFSSDIFKDEAGQSKPIHYYASVEKRNMLFKFDLSHLPESKLLIGKAKFLPLAFGNKKDLDVIASYDTDLFNLVLNGMLEFPLFNEDFNITIKDFTIGTNGYNIPDMHILPGQEQVFELFGASFTLRDKKRPAVLFKIRQNVLYLDMAGEMDFYGHYLDFKSFTVSSDGAIKNTDLKTKSFDIVANLISAESLKIQNNILMVNANLILPPSFSSGKPEKFSFSIKPDGEINGLNNNIVLKNGEDPNEKGVNLGLDPFFVNLKPAKAEMHLYPQGKIFLGDISLTVNTYWPGWPKSTKVPVTAKANFSSQSKSVQWTTLADASEYETSFAGFLKLKIKNLGVRFTDKFELVCSGNFMPDVAGVKGEGVDFSNFTIFKGGFNWGFIGGGYFNIQGFEVSVSRSFLDTNPKPFDVYTSDEFGAEDVSKDTKTINPGAFCLEVGGSVKYYNAFDCGVDEVIFYKSNKEFHFVVKNAELRIQGGMFSGNLDMEFHMNSVKRLDYQIIIAGDVIFNSQYRLIAAGEIRVDEKNDDYGFGLFVGAGGLDIQLGPLPVYIQDLGGGFFYKPDEKIEDLVIKHCRLENTTTINDRFAEYKQHDPDLLALFLYGGISMPTNNFMHGRALLTITSSHLRIDNECIFLDDPSFEKTGITPKSTGHFQIPFEGDFYAEGNFHVYIKSKQSFANQSLITGEGLAEFWVYGSDVWGVHGATNINVINSFNKNADFYLIPSGLFVEMGVSRDFNYGLISVDAGLDVAAWAKWQDPKSFGGFIDSWIDAQVLWGVAKARGELGAIIKYENEPFFYGIADLTLSALGYEWNGKAWAKWYQDEFTAGLGGNNELENLISETKLLFEEMLDGKDGTESELQNNKLGSSWAAQAGLSDKELDAIISSLATDPISRQAYYDLISDEAEQWAGMVDLSSSVTKTELSEYGNIILSILSEPDFAAMINGSMQTNETIDLDAPSIFEVKTDDYRRNNPTDYRRKDSTDYQRRQSDMSDFSRNINNVNDISVRTVMPQNTVVRNNPEIKKRYPVFSNSPGRVRIDENLDNIINDNRTQAAKILSDVTLMLDSLKTISDIEPTANPLTVQLNANNKSSPQFFEVDEQTKKQDVENLDKFEENFDGWLETFHHNIVEFDTTHTRILRALEKESSIAAIGQSYAIANFQLDELYSFFTKPIENEYVWFEEYYGMLMDPSYDSMMSDFLTDVAFSDRFKSILAKAGSDRTELLGIIDNRVRTLRIISGTNLWPSWDSIFLLLTMPGTLNSNQISAIRTIWAQTGYYLWRTIPVLFGSTKTNALSLGYKDIMNKYQSSVKSIVDAHVQLTESTDALWDRYAAATENLYNLYEQYNSYQNQLSSGQNQEALTNPLQADMKVPAVTNLSARVEAEPLRYSSTVHFSWNVDDPSILTEAAFSINSGSSMYVSGDKFRAVGGSYYPTLHFFPDKMPVQHDGYKTFLLRVRGRSGRISQSALMFKAINSDKSVLKGGSVYDYK